MNNQVENIFPKELLKKLIPLQKELLCIYLLLLCILAPSSTWKAEFGDGREYILQTQSIVIDRSLSVSPIKRGSYFNETNPFGITLKIKPSWSGEPQDLITPEEQNATVKTRTEEADQYGGGFGGLYKTLNSTESYPDYKFIHPWIYSAAVSPLYICTKFLGDLFRYLGSGAIIILFSVIICSLLFQLGKKLLIYWNSLKHEKTDFYLRPPSINFGFAEVTLSICALILRLSISPRPNPSLFEYQAFYIANIIFFSSAIVLIWRLSKTWLNLIFIAAICLSPIVPHIKWAHSEVFCFATVILGLGLTQVDKWRSLSPIFIGIGAAQNIPIILTLPLHLFLCLSSSEAFGLSTLQRLKKIPRSLIISYFFAILLPAIIAVQNYNNFGSWNLISTLNQANIENLTLQRIKSVLFSPQIGALLYFPAAWIAIVLGCLSGRFKTVALTVITSLAMVLLSSTTANINSAQLSATRYSIWTLSPLYLLPILTLFKQRVFKRWQVGIVILSIAIAFAGIGWLKTYKFIFGNVIDLFSLNRARSEIAALYRWSGFEDDIEPLVENIQRAELREPYTFSRIYIWNLGKGRSLWIVSKRSFRKISSITVGFKQGLSMETNAQLSEIFHTAITDNGDIRLTPKRSKGIPRRRGQESRSDESPPNSEVVKWNRSPYWGSYQMLWISGEVLTVANNEAVKVAEANGEAINR